MTPAFLAAAAALLLATLALLLRPYLLRRKRGAAASQRRINIAIYRDQLDELASLPFVMSMEEWHPAEPENDTCQWVVQDWTENQRNIWDQGIFGMEEILGFTDTGLDVDHWAFKDPGVPITDTGEFPTHRKVVVYKHYPAAGGVGEVR